MNNYPKSILLSVLVIASIAFIVEVLNRLPSNELGLVVSTAAAPVQLLSTIDLQRELNRRYPKLKLKEDGVYGTATKAAHERAIGDQYAKELMEATK